MSATVLAEKPVKKKDHPWQAAFEKAADDRKEAGWLSSIRKKALVQFLEKGFPTSKDEEWIFTNVDPIAALPAKPLMNPHPEKILAADIQPFILSDTIHHLLVFMDGHFHAGLSHIRDLKGVTVGSLQAALGDEAALVKKHLSQHVQMDHSPFAALNTAFFSDGGFIHVTKGQQVEEPVHLLFVSSGRHEGITSSPRNLVILEEGSSLRLLESHVSLGNKSSFTNAVSEIVVGSRAMLEHCKLQGEARKNFHVASLHFTQAEKSQVTTHSISVGSAIARNNLYMHLDGENIESILNGLYLADGRQLVDHHTVVDHSKPNCNSHEFYHGILDGQSRGVFNGKIFVRKDAQKTDAKQTNRNLLLSDQATIDTKPQLEIFADDVKCTHGATIGQLDEEAIFYLRARGIGEELARKMLLHAFAADIIHRIQIEEVRERLNELIGGGLESHLPSIS